MWVMCDIDTVSYLRSMRGESVSVHTQQGWHRMRVVDRIGKADAMYELARGCSCRTLVWK